MKKRFLVSAVLFLFFFILPKAQNVWDGSVAETYAGGNGSEENPYQISNGAELAKLSQDVNNGMTFKDVFFELTDDIILNKDVMDENGKLTNDSANLNIWIPIGDRANQEDQSLPITSFNGSFNGNGYEISGVYINTSDKKYSGLFACIEGRIANVGITNSYIAGQDYCGGICGYLVSGSISNCYNKGTIKGSQNTGGLIGFSAGKISDCYNSGLIIGMNFTGGIVGQAHSCSVSNCYNTGTVKAIYPNTLASAGGIVGWSGPSFPYNYTINNCFNKGNITSNGAAGGIAASLNISISDCYNEGHIEGKTTTGGIVGFFGNGRNATSPIYISKCYNTGTIINLGETPSPTIREIGTGGIAGVSIKNAEITSCHNKGEITGLFQTGGIVGWQETAYNTTNSYNTAAVNGKTYTGGLVGNLTAGSLYSCYNIGEIKGNEYTGNIAGDISNYTNTSILYNYYLKYQNDTYCGVNGEDEKGLIEGFTTEEFKSGKVTWLLNEKEATKENSLWFQNIDNTAMPIDPYPTLDNSHGLVYATGDCYNHITKYSNTFISDIPEHSGKNGICKYCDHIIPVEPQNINDIYQIGTVGELYWFANFANGLLNGPKNRNSLAQAVLTQDIIINENILNENGQLTNDSVSLIPWTPIGNIYNCFSGSFDGKGHIISGIYCNAPDKKYQGLFGCTNGQISNLGLENSYIKGSSNIGSLSGVGIEAQISNCYSTSTVKGLSHIGGIIGSSFNIHMNNCFFAGNIQGQVLEKTGKIIGDCNSNIYMTNCYYLYTPQNPIKGTNGTLDKEGSIEGKEEMDFTSGEITWLLNNEKTENITWYQNIDKANKDNLPTLNPSHSTVYPVYNCPLHIHHYSNTQQTHIPDHQAENGLCIYCGDIIISEPSLINDSYQITHVGELYWFANLVNGKLEGIEKNNSANAVLTNNITINEIDFINNGTDISVSKVRFPWNAINNYTGTFDGQGHSIKGLYIKTSDNYQGLFGILGSNGMIMNVKLTESYIKGSNYVGGIAGTIRSSSKGILNCHNDSYIIGNDYVGGIAGQSSSTIEKCSNYGSIKGESEVGGITGYAEDSIRICYNSGNIEGSYRIGGITGNNESAINNCYNTANVNGEEYTGGIVGYMRTTSTENGIFNCHSTGHTTGIKFVGSIAGMNIKRGERGSTVSNCYYINHGDAAGGINNEDIINEAEGRSSDEFANGTVYKLLNTESNRNIWYQEIGKNPYPVLNFFVITNIKETPAINDNSYVNVYSINGITVRKNVNKTNALNGLPAGIYIVNNKKIIVRP